MPKMKLQLSRFSSDTDSTLGLLHNVTGEPRFMCYTLEDEFRTKKVWGETRIPQGTYKLRIRQYGGFHERYKLRYNAFHKGMIEIVDVQNFKHVLFHIGNDDDDTAGCILLGDSQRQNITRRGFIGYSGDAYERVYRYIMSMMLKGVDVELTIKDLA